MRKRLSAAAIVAICLLGFVGKTLAQDDSGQFRPFNGLFAGLFTDGPQSQQQAQRSNSNQYYNANQQPTRAPVRAQPPAQAQPALAPPAVEMPVGIDNSAPAAHNVTGGNGSFQWSDGSVPSVPQQFPGSGGDASGSNSSATSSASPGAPLLYQRLNQYRVSPFGDAPEQTVSAPPSAPAATPTAAPARPDTAVPTPAAQAAASPTDSLPPPPDTPASAQSAPPAEAATPAPAVQPQQPTAAEPQRVAAVHTPAPQEPSVLVDHKSPQLSVETIGPRKISVGKEATYEVVLQNSGDQAAEEVAVSVGLPAWAQINNASPSTGDVAAASPEQGAPCRWTLHRIEARAKEVLTLKIVPRESRPFELAVHWDFKQTPTEALIEVQEAKLAMQLDGPREVLYGKKELYKLKLDNRGNGSADNVVLTLMPVNSADTQPVTHRLGTIAAGDQRTIEIELTARQAGRVTIRVEANGDGTAHAALAENVVVHRGGLQVQIEGPAMQYVGTPAAYRLVVSNPGDAPSKQVKVIAKLPTGMRFISGTDGATAETGTETKVRWTLERLAPGEQRSLQMKCSLSVSGPNRIEVASDAEGELVAATQTTTRVEAVADLRLEIKEPEGPVPVGAEAVYELHLRNRGTRAAENVEVLSYFSNGVDPFAADGQTNRVSPGQVIFDPIAAIAPASEVVLTVKARAQKAGNHVFRAEVRCKSDGTRLVREETTHYYQDTPGVQSSPAEDRFDAAHEDPRTADRQAPSTLPPAGDEPTRAIKR